jgi:hypothetical protein
MSEMRANAVALLESFGVDLVLSGHSHIYERSYLINGHYGFSNTLESTMIKDAGSGKPGDTGPYRKPGTGPAGNQGAVYVVAGSSGWATFRTGFHPIMYFDALQVGSLVLDISGNRLDAKFLRETGAIDDYFSILKGVGPEELTISNFSVSNGETLLRWKTVPGRKYRVQRSASLQNPSWIAASDLIVATGATTTWKAPVPPGNAESFYRVVQVPPPPPPPHAATVKQGLSEPRSLEGKRPSGTARKGRPEPANILKPDTVRGGGRRSR